MTLLFPTRSRWVSCCCIVTVSISAATIYWRIPRGVQNEANQVRLRIPGDEEIDLAPTVSNALEIKPILNASPSANSPWNPEPQWNPSLTALPLEMLPGQNHSSAAITPIPEAFPLEPRLKKEPPFMGDAIASAFSSLGQPQSSDTQSKLPASPFVAKPVIPLTGDGQVAHHPANASGTPSDDRRSAWPDLTYAADVAHEPNAMSRGRSNPSELSTPHLLTGAALRPPILPPTLPGPAEKPSSGFMIKPNQPSPGNYILQPMRSESGNK